MTSAEIVNEIQRLTEPQQLELQETLARLLRKHAPAQDIPDTQRTELAAAARALLVDYQTDPELTAFTALDSDSGLC